MFNRVCIIGSLWEIKKQEDGNFYLKISTTRPFLNDKFESIIDFLNVVIWKEHYQQIKGLLKKGILIFIEGRIESKITNNDKVEPINYLIVENVLPLCSTKNHC